MIFSNLSLREKKWLFLFLLCLFLWWLVAPSGTASASGVYTITEAEMQALDSRLNRLAQMSSTQQTESKRLQEQLTRSEAQLKTLKIQLDTSTAQLQTAQESLANANQFLKESAAAEKRTRLRIKAQRNAWIVATITAIIVAVSS